MKWNSQVFKDIELDVSQDVLTFKTQLYALTSVPIEKQKIMVAGKMIKDDT